MSVSFDYTIKRHPKRKRIALMVTDQGVEVRAPIRVSDKTLHQWVTHHQAWVHEQLDLNVQRQQQKPMVTAGVNIRILDALYTLCIHPDTRNEVITVSEQLHIHHTEKQTPTDVFSAWLKQKAKHYISPRCQSLATTLQVQNQITHIGFRKTKSKWGHCTTQGKLQFNWLLMMAPTQVVDYVIIHELCHLTHMNHSRAFWQLVAQYCPDYKAHKQWLKENGHRISL